MKATSPKNSLEAPVTLAPKKGSSASKAIPKPRMSISSKGKVKEKKLERMAFSLTPEPIDVKFYNESEKRANSDTLDGSRIVRKKQTYQPMVSTPAYCGGNQAIDLVANRLLSVNPRMMQEVL